MDIYKDFIRNLQELGVKYSIILVKPIEEKEKRRYTKRGLINPKSVEGYNH